MLNGESKFRRKSKFSSTSTEPSNEQPWLERAPSHLLCTSRCNYSTVKSSNNRSTRFPQITCLPLLYTPHAQLGSSFVAIVDHGVLLSSSHPYLRIIMFPHKQNQMQFPQSADRHSCTVCLSPLSGRSIKAKTGKERALHLPPSTALFTR